MYSLSKPVRKLLKLSLFVFLFAPSTSYAISGDETSVKVAFLYNFFKFIQWPNTNKINEYALCVPQPGKFANALMPLDGKVVNGHVLKVLLNVTSTELNKCHMLFLNEASSTQMFISQIEALSILTVSDQPNFIEQGGMIGLVPDGNRISFNVNLTQAHQHSVHISAELLKLAQKVIH